MSRQTKSDRIVHVNAVIEEIAKRGRRFFHHRESGRTARFEITSGGRVRLRDEYTDKLIDTSSKTRWTHFSGGGTLQNLVHAMTRYITDGNRVASGHFGPFSHYLCGGDLWGYGLVTMAELRAAITDNPCIMPRNT